MWKAAADNAGPVSYTHLVESTYGNRLHEPPPDYSINLAQIIQRTFDRGGNVVIPSFAVGRTQEMLYFLRDIKARGLVHGHDNFPVYVDSPLAIEATTIFQENRVDCFDDEAMELVKHGINPITFLGLELSVTSEESRAINFDNTPKVIISASGMCDAGRIKHHLKHNLWRRDSTVVFVGYQAVGTLGRSLLEGACLLYTSELSKKPDAIGFLLPAMEKSQLFPAVREGGALPRKTFSMGHAYEKRFYLECRKIQ